LSCDAIEYCTKHVPRWNPISFAGYNYRESGCSAAQEVAFVIANATACSEELIRRGLEVDSFAPVSAFSSLLTVTFLRKLPSIALREGSGFAS